VADASDALLGLNAVIAADVHILYDHGIKGDNFALSFRLENSFALSIDKNYMGAMLGWDLAPSGMNELADILHMFNIVCYEYTPSRFGPSFSVLGSQNKKMKSLCEMSSRWAVQKSLLHQLQLLRRILCWP